MRMLNKVVVEGAFKIYSMKRKFKKKLKFTKCCYNCKYRWLNCKERFTVEICDRFKFDSTSKSM